MLERRTGPPIMGLIFLTMVIACLGWAATADTEAVIESDSGPPTAIVQPAAAGQSSKVNVASPVANQGQS